MKQIDEVNAVTVDSKLLVIEVDGFMGSAEHLKKIQTKYGRSLLHESSMHTSIGYCDINRRMYLAKDLIIFQKQRPHQEVEVLKSIMKPLKTNSYAKEYFLN